MVEYGVTRLLFCSTAAACLAACGGGEVGGRVSGLGTDRSVTLSNNAADSLTVTKNGVFTFAKGLAAAKTYVVTVLAQPVGQLCDVTNGSGTMNALADSIDAVRVACADTASLTGRVSGLATGTAVTLSNGPTQLPLTTNGPFAFAGTVSDGTAYNVAVFAQPFGATCTVANGTGTFLASVATNIAVTCR